MKDDRQERAEQQQRSRAWYAILGFGALAGGAFVILRWIPDNPFHTPSELPGTARFNSNQLTGTQAPMLSVRSSEMGSIGQGCRVSDIALVQNHLGPLRQSTLQSLEVYVESLRRRRERFDPIGWRARADDPSTRDASDGAGCLVEFAMRVSRGERVALWRVSPDRSEVTPANPLARTISALAPGLRAH